MIADRRRGGGLVPGSDVPMVRHGIAMSTMFTVLVCLLSLAEVWQAGELSHYSY